MLEDIPFIIERLEKIILEVINKINSSILDLETISIKKETGYYSKQITKAGHFIKIKWSRNNNSEVILNIMDEKIILNQKKDFLFRIPIESINKSQNVSSQVKIFNEIVKKSLVKNIEN